MGTDRSHPVQPPARRGYSVARRALAGLLGVHLTAPAELPSPGIDEPFIDFREAARRAVIAADPVVRLTVRQSPLPDDVVMANFLVRAAVLADDLMLWRDISGSADLTLVFAQDLISDIHGYDFAAPAREAAGKLFGALRAASFMGDHVPESAIDSAVALTRVLAQLLGRRPLSVGPNGSRVEERFALETRHIDRGFIYPLLLQARLVASILAEELCDMLGIERLSEGTDLAGLVHALRNGALDDFSYADLSEVENLTLDDLAGVRWTLTGTLWPPTLDTSALKEQSSETKPGSGIYVVMTPGATDRSNAEVRV